MSDIRSKKCVFVSHCMLAQCVRATGIVKHFPGPVRPVVQFCLDNDINIMQMPCPETLCSSGGLGRSPHGKKWYDENGLRETAKNIAFTQVEYMSNLIQSGYEILAIIGVEFSPACAPTYLNKGPVIYREKGIFIEELQKCLIKRGINVRLIGVNQRAHRKLDRELKELLQNSPSPPEHGAHSMSRKPKVLLTRQRKSVNVRNQHFRGDNSLCRQSKKAAKTGK